MGASSPYIYENGFSSTVGSVILSLQMMNQLITAFLLCQLDHWLKSPLFCDQTRKVDRDLVAVANDPTPLPGLIHPPPHSCHCPVPFTQPFPPTPALFKPSLLPSNPLHGPSCSGGCWHTGGQWPPCWKAHWLNRRGCFMTAVKHPPLVLY